MALPRSRLDRLLRPTLPELWLFLAVALPVLAGLLATLPTVDLAYQLRAGSEILDGQGIPTSDTWTFTAAGLPWLDQQWGAQVVLAAVYRAAGWTGLAILRAALVGLVSGLVLVAIRRRAPGIHPRIAALIVLAAFVVTAPALALRPQLLGMALFAGTLAILAGRRMSPRQMWLVPIIALAWANIHGSFVLAPVLAGLAWLEDAADGSTRARKTLLVAVLTALATLVTPFGPGAWSYALGLVANPQVTAQISEWRPPTLGDVPGALFWASAVLVALAAVVLARRAAWKPWPVLLGLALFAGLAAIAGRGVAWWPGYAAVALAGLAAASIEPSTGLSRPIRGSRLNAAIGVGLILAGAALVPVWRPVDAGTGAPSGLLGHAPPGITGALRTLASPSDRVWNPQVWGSWLEFAVQAPRYALDSRIEVIPVQVWSDAEVVATAGPSWSDVLDRAGATIVIVDAESTRLEAVLAGSPAWAVAYSDPDGSIWIRSARRLASAPRAEGVLRP